MTLQEKIEAIVITLGKLEPNRVDVPAAVKELEQLVTSEVEGFAKELFDELHDDKAMIRVGSVRNRLSEKIKEYKENQ